MSARGYCFSLALNGSSPEELPSDGFTGLDTDLLGESEGESVVPSLALRGVARIPYNAALVTSSADGNSDGWNVDSNPILRLAVDGLIDMVIYTPGSNYYWPNGTFFAPPLAVSSWAVNVRSLAGEQLASLSSAVDSHSGGYLIHGANLAFMGTAPDQLSASSFSGGVVDALKLFAEQAAGRDIVVGWVFRSDELGLGSVGIPAGLPAATYDPPAPPVNYLLSTSDPLVRSGVVANRNGVIVHTSETPHTGTGLLGTRGATTRLYHYLTRASFGYHAICGRKVGAQQEDSDLTDTSGLVKGHLVNPATHRTAHAGYAQSGSLNGNSFVGVGLACLARNFDASIGIPNYVVEGGPADITFSQSLREDYLDALCDVLNDLSAGTDIPKRHATSLTDLRDNGGIIGHGEVDSRGKQDPGFTDADWQYVLDSSDW